MTPAKLKKLMAKLKAGFLSHDEQVKHFDDLKSALMKLSEEQSKAMAQKNPQTFSSWPPEMPERKCSWRLSDELQEARLGIPEPIHIKGKTVEYFQPYEFAKKFTKILIHQPGASYYAWTADGRTPIFPIPL